ncbi:CU044_2847 family protein [Streptomyces sp. NPDC017941]|uniref:CU044_2847 family protein n=1 Tax=Streptomyces sp. NPDC017941 TaxID=3365018 RepID=UPI0037A0C911
MPHYDYLEFTLDDGARVRLELAAAGAAPATPGAADAGLPDTDSTDADLPDADLPGGISGVTPVGRGARVGTLATDALRTVLSPLGPVLQQVHDAVRDIPDPPQEISVDSGIQIGQDLKLGIVGAGGQASMTISATWQLTPRSRT